MSIAASRGDRIDRLLQWKLDEEPRAWGEEERIGLELEPLEAFRLLTALGEGTRGARAHTVRVRVSVKAAARGEGARGTRAHTRVQQCSAPAHRV